MKSEFQPESLAELPVALAHHLFIRAPEDVGRAVDEVLAWLARRFDSRPLRFSVFRPHSTEVLHASSWPGTAADDAHDSFAAATTDAFLHALRADVHVREWIRDGSRAAIVVGLKDAWGVLSFELAGELEPAELDALQDGAELLVTAVARREVERALRASEARFRALAEHSTDLISEFDDKGRYLYVSPSVKELLGCSPDALLGQSPGGIVHPDDVGDAGERLANAYATAGISHSIHRLKHADGSWRWFDNTGRAYPGQDGTRFVSIGRDITERLHTEEALRESQAQLLQAQKLDAVGRLAGGIAHDFNNLLTIISGNGELLAPKLARQGMSEIEVQEILGAAERGAALTRQLVAFSRPHLGEGRLLDLKEVVAGFEPMLRRLTSPEVGLEIESAGDLGAVEADPHQIEQVVMNLAVNARDAMPGGGRLRIALEQVEVGDGRARRLGLKAPGPCVRIAFHDTGSGIPAELLPKLFEPFFSTKSKASSAGLGLSIAYRVLQQWDGAIDVESELGRGSTFYVYLPSVGQAPVLSAPQLPVAPVPSGDETLLVVDDETATRRVMVRMLEQAGYRVLQAEDPYEALVVAKRHAGEIDLLVTDLLMPGIGGTDLAKRLRRRDPRLRVLFVSGHPGEMDDPARESGIEFLAKPFTQQRFLRTVRERLDAPDPASV